MPLSLDMAGAERFEDLLAWQRAHELHIAVWKATSQGPASRDFRFRDQIRDASESAERNVAEGFGRFNPGQFAYFLDIARASTQETKTLLKKGLAVAYWNEEEFIRLDTLADRTVQTIAKFQRYLRSPQAKENASRRYRSLRPNAPNGPNDPNDCSRSSAPEAISACALHHLSPTDDGIMALPGRNGGVLVEFQPMSPEEVERTVQFLLHQQARFEANFERLSAKTDLITDGLVGLTGIVGRVTERIEQLAEAQGLTDQQLKESSGQVGDLGAYIKTVESHLNVVIETFDRHLREDHGHRPS